MDVPVAVGIDIPPHGCAQVETDLRFIIPKGCYLHVYCKGSAAIVGLSFDLGCVDEEFTGKLTLVCWNKSGTLVHVPRGKCIAQIVLRRYERANVQSISLEEMDSHKTARGEGRLNSSRTGL